MADKIVVLRSGVVEQVGRPLDLYNHPANQFVAGFIGSPKMNVLRADVVSSGPRGTTVRVGSATFDVPVLGVSPGTVTLGIRPEHLATGGEGASLGEARVVLVEHLGGATVVYGTLPDGQSLTIALEGQRAIPADGAIPIVFDPARCHLFGTDGRRLGRTD